MPKQTLNAALITKARKDARPGQLRYEIRDAASNGLILRVGPSGAAWQFRYGLNHKDIRLVLGGLDTWTLAEARDIVARGQAMLREKTGVPDTDWLERLMKRAGKITQVTLAPAPEKPRDLFKWSFEQGRDAFLNDVQRTLARETFLDYSRKLRQPELEPFLRQPLPSISLLDMAKVIAGIHRSGREPHAENTGRVISSMWTWLARPENRKDSGVQPFVMRELRAPARTKKPGRRMVARPTLEDLPRIVAISRSGAMDASIGCAVELVAWTLQRRRAVASAKIEDFVPIDGGTEGLWYVFADDRKRDNGEPHVIPLTRPAWACFQRALELTRDTGSEYLFPQQRAQRRGMAADGHVHPSTLTHAFLYMPGVTSSPHDVRRIFGTYGEAVLGISRAMTKLILDHSEGGSRSDVTGRHYSMHDGTHQKFPIMRQWQSALEPEIAKAVAELEPVAQLAEAIKAAHPSRKEPGLKIAAE